MSYFAVFREAGPSWEPDRAITEQPDVNEHAAFINRLADEGFVLIAGPLGEGESGHLRVLLIVDASSAVEIAERLAGDPWVTTGRIRLLSIEPWSVLVGDERLAGLGTAQL
jgi:uncharacterized protein YciI